MEKGGCVRVIEGEEMTQSNTSSPRGGVPERLMAIEVPYIIRVGIERRKR